MTDQNPAPGWYPAPHANNEQRYWDGIQWLEPQPPTAPAVADAATVAYPVTPSTPDAPTQVFPGTGSPADAQTVAFSAEPPSAADLVDTAAPGYPSMPPSPTGASAGFDAPPPAGFTSASSAPTRKSKKRGWIIGGSIAAGVILISGVASAMGGGAKTDVADEKPVETTVTTVEEEPVEEPVVMVSVPDVTGQTATEALVTLMAAGLNPPALTALADPLAKVLSTSPAAGTEVEEGTEIALTLEEKPAYTLVQQNAISSAQNYLSFTGFSRTGLIGQLEYEGFSTEDATFGVDNAGADWNAEAAEKAAQYLEFTSFARQGLYDQMAYEGFLPAEIEFGLAAVGY